MSVDSSEDPGVCQCRRMPSWLGGHLEFRHSGRTPRWQRPAYAGPPCKTAPYTVIVPIYPPDPAYRCKPMAAMGLPLDPSPLESAYRPDPSYRRKSVSQQDEPSGEASNSQ